VGSRVKVKVVKNKIAPPFKQVEFDILWTEGISAHGDILDLAIEEKLIQKSGAWFSMGGENLGQGRETTRQFLRDNPDICDTLRQQILDARGIQWVDSDTETETETETPKEQSNAT
ncbi:MAG: DNA recombination/repair protein RecA, partial [Candidatus Hydrogenedentota bacterium]